MNDIYIVKPGDSLSRIARHHGTTPQTLAELNYITNIDVILVGQKLQLPPAKPSVSNVLSTTSTPNAEQEESGALWIQLQDAFLKPINGLKAQVIAGGQTHECQSTTSGYLPSIPIDQAGQQVRILIEKVTGGMKEIAQWISETGNTHLLLTSPKAAVASQQRVHEGPPKRAKPPKPQPIGTVVETRSPNGHPVQQVHMECPNPENLKLGPNFKYRDIIIAASKRSGFKPQAIAAVMNAEAATIKKVTLLPKVSKDGKPVIDKKTGKPAVRKRVENTGEWNAKSASPLSSARGMTQFLDGSWIDQALANGTHLNEKVKQQKWLTTATTTDKKGKPHTVKAFQLADSKVVTATHKRSLARVLSGKPYMTGWASASDANLQSLLDLRFDPEYAINAAVDYGTQNLKGLSNAGYKVDSLSDGEKAKIMYLCHHLGNGDAEKFIDNTMTAEHAQYLLENQLTKDGAAAKARSYKGDYLATHRSWLNKFINDRVIFKNFMCDPSKAETVRDLIPITEAIRV